MWGRKITNSQVQIYTDYEKMIKTDPEDKILIFWLRFSIFALDSHLGQNMSKGRKTST